MSNKQIGIIGAGSWGTALAQHLASNGGDVLLWGRDSAVLNGITSDRINYKYLPDVNLSARIKPVGDFNELVNSEVLVLSVPTNSTREICENLKNIWPEGKQAIFVSTGKGLESGSNKRLSEIITDVFGPEAYVFSLSGPSFALEVGKGMPTALVLAGSKNERSEEIRRLIIKAFHVGTLRIYTSDDLIGVELGGVLKNVVSVASGIGDGLGLGLNARAGLLTRGLRELSALIQAEGGKASTVMGLSGLGDLMLTATGDLSRNRRFGILLGRGLTIEAAKEEIGQTIEAITACICAYELSKKHNLDTPIINQVAKIIHGETTPSHALSELLMREQKAE
jgi:glycerol-3-phosphate dehydrogenase (NAD(P)+)